MSTTGDQASDADYRRTAQRRRLTQAWVAFTAAIGMGLSVAAVVLGAVVAAKSNTEDCVRSTADDAFAVTRCTSHPEAAQGSAIILIGLALAAIAVLLGFVSWRVLVRRDELERN